MNGKELKKKCEALGWYLVNVEGSHHHMKHPVHKHKITIPIHGSKDVPIGTLIDIKKKAGLK